MSVIEKEIPKGKIMRYKKLNFVYDKKTRLYIQSLGSYKLRTKYLYLYNKIDKYYDNGYCKINFVIIDDDVRICYYAKSNFYNSSPWTTHSAKLNG